MGRLSNHNRLSGFHWRGLQCNPLHDDQFHIDASGRSNQPEIILKYDGCSQIPYSAHNLSDFQLQFAFDQRANLLHPPPIHPKIAISGPGG
mgnify:CR=1 FL=1